MKTLALFYVAITRCTEVLVLSSAARMARDFAWKIRADVLPGRSAQASAIASTFLDELGAGAPDAIRGEAWVY
jgi:superfamily I DNA/RNA helicase